MTEDLDDWYDLYKRDRLIEYQKGNKEHTAKLDDLIAFIETKEGLDCARLARSVGTARPVIYNRLLKVKRNIGETVKRGSIIEEILGDFITTTTRLINKMEAAKQYTSAAQAYVMFLATLSRLSLTNATEKELQPNSLVPPMTKAQAQKLLEEMKNAPQT